LTLTTTQFLVTHLHPRSVSTRSTRARHLSSLFLLSYFHLSPSRLCHNQDSGHYSPAGRASHGDLKLASWRRRRMTIYWLNTLQSYLRTQKMPTADRLSTLLDSSRVQLVVTRSLMRQLSQRRSPASEKERLCNPPYIEAGAFEAVERLFASPWFQRTWTIQEAVLSNEPWVMSGTSVRHWENSVGCCAGLRDLGLFQPRVAMRGLDTSTNAPSDVPPKSFHGSQAALTIWRMKMDNYSGPGMMSLLTALVETRHTQATNPLDNVYGFWVYANMMSFRITPYSQHCSFGGLRCKSSGLRYRISMDCFYVAPLVPLQPL
jgi:hypothetical protein